MRQNATREATAMWTLGNRSLQDDGNAAADSFRSLVLTRDGYPNYPTPNVVPPGFSSGRALV